MPKTKSGFTLVELLIVIVVIGILAAITLVAYNGVQAKARDAQRQSDINSITKALEMYYIDNGQYPTGSCTANCSINSGWSTTADGSWQNLVSQLVPQYMTSLPVDPVSTAKATGASPMSDPNAYDYSYLSWAASGYCGTSTSSKQGYLIVYRLEGSQVQRGSCPTTPKVGPYSGSNYYSLK